jgi:hypothetical protein
MTGKAILHLAGQGGNQRHRLNAMGCPPGDSQEDKKKQDGGDHDQAAHKEGLNTKDT